MQEFFSEVPLCMSSFFFFFLSTYHAVVVVIPPFDKFDFQTKV